MAHKSTKINQQRESDREKRIQKQNIYNIYNRKH